MSETMQVELYGGPADGIVLAIPVDAKLWLVPTPMMMTPAQFIALENGGAVPDQVLPVREHLYVYTSEFGAHSRARLFSYRGPRRAT